MCGLYEKKIYTTISSYVHVQNDEIQLGDNIDASMSYASELSEDIRQIKRGESFDNNEEVIFKP